MRKPMGNENHISPTQHMRAAPDNGEKRSCRELSKRSAQGEPSGVWAVCFTRAMDASVWRERRTKGSRHTRRSLRSRLRCAGEPNEERGWHGISWNEMKGYHRTKAAFMMNDLNPTKIMTGSAFAGANIAG